MSKPMNIVVCIKQVPDTAKVKLDPETNNLRRDGVVSILNPVDEQAIETALQLKAQFGGTVTAVTMGPSQADSILKHAYTLGVDEVLLVSDRAFAGADALATAYTLAKAIESKTKFDLIILGKQSVDGDTGQVGGCIAEYFGFPLVTSVSAIEKASNTSLIVHREGCEQIDVIECPLPGIITVSKSINEPRYPHLGRLFNVESLVIPTVSAQDISANSKKIGQTGSPTIVERCYSPKVDMDKEVIQDDNGSSVSTILEKVHSLGIG
jgi:electron transfer flavoprotein beta subunit